MTRSHPASPPSSVRTLAELAPNETAVVTAVTNEDSMRRRLLDLGLTEGTRVLCVGQSPAGDPAAYLIRGAVIALRRADSRAIRITRIGEEAAWD